MTGVVWFTGGYVPTFPLYLVPPDLRLMPASACATAGQTGRANEVVRPVNLSASVALIVGDAPDNHVASRFNCVYCIRRQHSVLTLGCYSRNGHSGGPVDVLVLHLKLLGTYRSRSRLLFRIDFVNASGEAKARKHGRLA